MIRVTDLWRNKLWGIWPVGNFKRTIAIYGTVLYGNIW